MINRHRAAGNLPASSLCIIHQPSRALESANNPWLRRACSRKEGAGDIPLNPSAALFLHDKITGSSTTVAVYEGSVYWRDERSAGSSRRPRSEEIVSQHSSSPEAAMGRRASELKPQVSGQAAFVCLFQKYCCRCAIKFQRVSYSHSKALRKLSGP